MSYVTSLKYNIVGSLSEYCMTIACVLYDREKAENPVLCEYALDYV